MRHAGPESTHRSRAQQRNDRSHEESTAPTCSIHAPAPDHEQHAAAHFGTEDAEAHSADDFAAAQAKDTWCQAMAKNRVPLGTMLEGRVYQDPHRANLLMRRRCATDRHDQVLVPLALRAFILRRYHGLPITGHTGRNKTYAQLTLRYYWPGMAKDLNRWIQACLTCRRRKTPRPLRAGHPGTVSNAQEPWETVAIDIVSASAASKGGYTKILTIIDTFTRYVLAIPLRNANAEEIGNALFSELFCRFGKPKRIHSDEGREFVNVALTALYERWGIAQTSTGGYQPQANPVERFHRFMNSSMTMLSAKFGSDWPSYLPATVFAYNASVCTATGYTPFALIYGGRHPTLLQDIDLDMFDTQAGTPEYSSFRARAIGSLKAAYIAVRTQQEKLAKANRDAIIVRRGANRKGGKPPPLVQHDVGDLVLYWEPAQPKNMQTTEQRLANLTTVKAPKKWKASWTGPHEVTQKKKDATGFRYTIYHKKRGVPISTHVNKICRFQPWSEGILSTSADIDAKGLYKCGSWVDIGSLVIVPLKEPHPFGVAKLLECETDGSMTLQWMGNAADATNGVFEPGWRKSTRGGSTIYYATTSAKDNHTPYTTDMDGLHMNQRDVIIHSFELTGKGLLPAPLLRAIARHPYVWWDPQEKGKSKYGDDAVAREDEYDATAAREDEYDAAAADEDKHDDGATGKDEYDDGATGKDEYDDGATGGEDEGRPRRRNGARGRRSRRDDDTSRSSPRSSTTGHESHGKRRRSHNNRERGIRIGKSDATREGTRRRARN